ncbi:signal-regulatory protein beta-2 [Notothenia coriiceps]|uniref:Signal-regulatory protein beta-2 n=1 Tax=Notothenia coriiceps TaxID=8208 RepID=A0A6I9Q620_9TELE|nr:PREDICTED: signal-regulatory protein beta-2 [Notothenia coriiceps]
MLIIVYLLLMLGVGRCTHDQILETKTVGVGKDVTLTCSRQKSLDLTHMFWIRHGPGNVPEVLGRTHSFDYDGVNKSPRITAKQGPGTFLLQISKTEPSDTGVYYCLKVNTLDMTFWNATFLRVKGPEPDITAIIQGHQSDPVLPGDSVTLQCAVLSESQSRTCPGETRVFWFRAGSDESHPSVIYSHKNSRDDCENSPEASSPRKCIYNFSKDVSSSDAGTYYCAVATCGEILFGNGTKLDIEAPKLWDKQQAIIVLLLLAAPFAISLIVIAFLIHTIEMKTCDCCNASLSLRTNPVPASGDQQRQQREEDSIMYSAQTFMKRKTGRANRKNTKSAEGETIYTNVMYSVMD